MAILATDDFDSTTVDAVTVRFGPNEFEQDHYALEDVDNDGDIDTILDFRTQEINIGSDDDEAKLIGKIFDGDYFTDTDLVRIIPLKVKK